MRTIFPPIPLARRSAPKVFPDFERPERRIEGKNGSLFAGCDSKGINFSFQ
jgi:hypothetical protein